MNILYLCGSARSRGWVAREWLAMNKPIVAEYFDDTYVAHLKNGGTVHFCTYDRPERLYGSEFDLVIEDHEPITGDWRAVEETRVLVMSRIGRCFGPTTVKNPPAV